MHVPDDSTFTLLKIKNSCKLINKSIPDLDSHQRSAVREAMLPTVPTFAVRETDVSRHQGGPIEGPPETPHTSQN